ncbi:MAG: 3-deoxy-D-manno-octulosonic acid transferase, partial [Burkholderiales bacterium]|nr:3-deoxy-D-manno-octulosonic acid transferase [Burkholderiales bacterium]
SLLPFGGQNMIEAAACGCPALFGPHTWNFLEAADAAVAAGAAMRVGDAGALLASVQALLGDDAARARMALSGQEFAAAHRGATAATMAAIVPLVGAGGPGG